MLNILNCCGPHSKHFGPILIVGASRSLAAIDAFSRARRNAMLPRATQQYPTYFTTSEIGIARFGGMIVLAAGAAWRG